MATGRQKCRNVKRQRENLQPGWKQETGSSKATGGQGGGQKGGEATAVKAYLETVQLLHWRGGRCRRRGRGRRVRVGQKTEEEGGVSNQRPIIGKKQTISHN